MRNLHLLAIVALLCGCGLINPRVYPAEGIAIQYLDSSAFDQNLSRSLGADYPWVTVEMVAAASVNDIPSRLDKWLSAVSENGPGAVRAQLDPAYEGVAQRSAATAAMSLMLGAYEMIRQHMLYRSVGSYNATVLYSPDGMITRIVFVHQEQAQAQESGDASQGEDSQPDSGSEPE